MKKFLSRAGKVLVACTMIFSGLQRTTTDTKAAEAITGTQTIYVNGYDWGPGTDKTVIELSAPVSSVDTADFTANDHRTAVNWTAAGFPEEETDVARTVTNVYLSDEYGNATTEAESKYITVGLYVSPSDGDPFNYIVSTGFNKWAETYQVQITGSATTADGEKVELDIEDGTYDNMITNVDHLIEDKMDIDGTTYDYSYYQPEDTDSSKGLIIWLHGAGEGTHDPTLVTLGNKAVVWSEDEFTSIDGDAYVLYPQCPTVWMDVGPTLDENGKVVSEKTYCTVADGNVEDTIYTEDLMTLIENFVAAHPDIDPDNIVIGGCSNGGYMTMNMIIHYPDYFAAAYPTCEAYYDAAITDEQIEAIKDMPIWFTCAATDTTVDPTATSLPTYERLIEAGAENVYLTEFDKVVDTSGLYKDAKGNAYEYSGHWSWIYLDNNDAKYEETYEGGIHAWLASYLIPAPEAETQLYAEVTDAGEVISKMTIDFGEGNTVEGVDADTFTVHATASTTAIREGTSDVSYGDYDIDRTITKVEVDGSVVTLYFSMAEGAKLAYLSSARNYPADLTYKVTQNAPVTVNGEEVTYKYPVDAKNYIDEETEAFESVIVEDGINYEFYAPETEADTLIVWFHGNGEGDYLSSDNNVAQMLANRGTVAWATDEAQEIFGNAYVMAFQAPDTWYYAQRDGLLEKAYNEIMSVVEANGIDPSKIVVSGCSAGGYMTTRMIIAYPELFAAAMINCPALDVATARGGETPTDEELATIKDSSTKIWLVQSEDDSVVKTADCSQRLWAILTEGDEVTETRMEDDTYYSNYTTYEAASGKYLMSIFDNDADAKLDFSEDYNQDGEQELVSYSSHWSWIYTLRNIPENAEGTKIWQWAADVAKEVNGTQTIYVNGYDWGPGTDKTIIALDKEVEAVDPEDITVVDHRAYVNWSLGGTFVEGDIARTVVDAYLSDEEGNAVEGPSNYITVELYVSPSEGDPFNYSLATGFNSWADPYQVQVSGLVTVDGEKVNLDVEDGTYETMITNVDHLIEDTMDINGTTYDYSYYQPEETEAPKGLIIWLHGAGEGTHDPTLITLGNKAVVFSEDDFTSLSDDAYVLYPQSPTMWMDVGPTYDENGKIVKESNYCTEAEGNTEDTIYTEDLMTLIENFVAAHPNIDKDHIVIGGCSNGGYMTMNMIIHYPDYFAAAYPTCEAYYDSTITDEQIEAIKDMPIWFTCAATDQTVNPKNNSLLTYARLMAAGAENVHLSYFKNVVDTSGLYDDAEGNAYEYNGHWSWIYVFNNECVLNDGTTIHDWLASYLKVEKTVSGTQTIYVNGYDWGPSTDKTIITLDEEVDSIDASTFKAKDHREYVDWSLGGKFVEGNIAREVTNAYLSDEEGNPVDGSSKYITVELYVSPSDGDPFNYSLATGFNSWADPYQVQIKGYVTIDGEQVALRVEDGTYENMVTNIDHLIEDTMDINGTTYDYSYYQPEDTTSSKGLMIWLHGAGEGGHDPSLVTLGNKAVVWSEEEFTSMDEDAYVLYPQCPTMWMDIGENTYCTADTVEDTIYTEDLMTLIENFVAAHPDIDTNHIVIGGCSNGGYMTMNMIIHYPDYFAAAYPTCEAYYDAGITDEQIEAIKDMPIWFTCAATDTTVDPTANSVPTYERLIAAGAKNVYLTEFDKVVDTSGLYKDAKGNAYEYSGHWSWIYLDNNDAKYEETYEGGIHAWLASYLKTSLPFEDVPEGKWYYEYIKEAYEAGLMTGKSETIFDPYGTMTRGQVATVLYRMAGEPEVEFKGTFPDVPAGKYYSEAVEWAAENGIVTGYKSDGTFKPSNSVTRQEFAVMLYRYAGEPEVDTSVLADYPDVADVSSWAKDAMAWAVANGIISGDQGKLNPKGTATRAQAAKMLVVANDLFNEAYEGLNPSKAVEVTGGLITGTYANDEETVALYKGIPYAAAPVGDLRWKAPADVESWDGIKACTEWGKSAIQTTQSAFMMWSDEFIIEDTGYSEDCLTLNVYASTDDVADKPVIVYVHGGGFTSGGSSCDVYDGTYIAENDVVYVTINYRVGVMGFMATNELTEEGNGTSGNYGTLDIIKALQWVQDNIATFGGDPSNVTLMGQSAGSGMIQAVLASPLSQGLVSKALCESFQMYDYSLSDLETAEASWEAKAGGKTLEELRAMSAEEIFNLFGATGVPIVDGTVIPESFNAAIEDGSLTDVTLITGWVDMDTFLFSVLSGSTEEEVIENATKIVGEDKVDAFKEIYLTDYTDLSTAVHQFNIDYLMAEVGSHAAARTANEPTTYTYLFTHVMPGEMSEAYGAFHTADVPYFLGHLSHARDAYWTEDDQKVADNMSSYLLNFAKTGTPGDDWTTGENGDYMVLDAECEMTSLSQAKQDLFSGLF